MSASLSFHLFYHFLFLSFFVFLFSLSLFLSLVFTFWEGEVDGSWLYVGHSSSQASHSQEKRKFSYKRKVSSQERQICSHPEELLSSQDTKLTEDGTIVVRHLLPWQDVDEKLKKRKVSLDADSHLFWCFSWWQGTSPCPYWSSLCWGCNRCWSSSQWQSRSHHLQ